MRVNFFLHLAQKRYTKHHLVWYSLFPNLQLLHMVPERIFACMQTRLLFTGLSYPQGMSRPCTGMLSDDQSVFLKKLFHFGDNVCARDG